MQPPASSETNLSFSNPLPPLKRTYPFPVCSIHDLFFSFSEPRKPRHPPGFYSAATAERLRRTGLRCVRRRVCLLRHHARVRQLRPPLIPNENRRWTVPVSFPLVRRVPRRRAGFQPWLMLGRVCPGGASLECTKYLGRGSQPDGRCGISRVVGEAHPP